MLNLQALENAHSKYNNAVLKEADACGKEIRLITKKFVELDIPDTFYTWTERASITVNDQEEEEIDFSTGLLWDSKKSKIFHWFDDSHDLKVLAGETAIIRASVRPKLNDLVNEATAVLNTQIKELVSSELEEDSDLSDDYEPDSSTDRMMINGEQR